jgi:hypothetical protein
MQTVKWISDVNAALGTTGYSVLEQTWGGEVRRTTALFLRGSDGFTERVLILPAETVRGAF